MTLTNLSIMPPGGFPYYEPSIAWKTPPEMALQGLETVARALSAARAQNPSSGLDPSYEACVEAIKAFTCVRLSLWPSIQGKFCGPEPASRPPPSAPASRPIRGCASCGKRK